MAEEEKKKYGLTAIETWAAGSRKTWQFLKSRAMFIIILAALVFLGFVAYNYLNSDAGQRLLTKIGSIVREYNPVSLYFTQLKKAQDVGNIWTSETNLSQTKTGIVFREFALLGSPEIPSGSPIFAAYKLDIEGATLEPTLIQFFCSLKDQPESPTSVIPSSLVEVSGKTFRENIRCVVSPEVTQNLAGTYTLQGKLSFPAKTKNVKLNVYFTTSEQLELDNIGIEDFFSTYNIRESLPIRAKYNGEPVEMGIGVHTDNTQPVLIDSSSALIGITLTNRWDGKVSKITDLSFSLPDGIKVDEEINKNPTPICPFRQLGTSRGRVQYSMEDSYKNIQIEKGFSKTFECFLSIDPSILTPDEVYTQKTYVADAEYEFESEEKSIPITIKKVEA